MFGKNTIRKAVRNEDGLYLQTHSVFLTIQGEGPHAGRRAVFIRLTGCHLACTFCDTFWDDEHDAYVSIDDLAARVTTLWGNAARPLFVLTGGEPTRQNLGPLVRKLAAWKNSAIQIETAGSFWQEALGLSCVDVVVSPKTRFVDPNVAEIACAYKYVIRATDEFTPQGIPVTMTQNHGRPTNLAPPAGHLRTDEIYLTPCDEQNEEINAANCAKCVELALTHGYRVNVQIHKILGLE